MDTKHLYAVKVRRDDTVEVVTTEVVKETPQFFIISHHADGDGYPFGYSTRLVKERAHTSARDAVEAYMGKRQRDKEHAKAVIAQATKQIASANELLMHLPAAAGTAVGAQD